MFHLALHFLVPAALAGLFYKKTWTTAYLLMVVTMLVDLDHLFASPIYELNRCSIGFHPLHEWWFMVLYVALCFLPKTKLVGIGLSIHMALDAIDCQVTSGVWTN